MASPRSPRKPGQPGGIPLAERERRHRELVSRLVEKRPVNEALVANLFAVRARQARRYIRRAKAEHARLRTTSGKVVLQAKIAAAAPLLEATKRGGVGG